VEYFDVPAEDLYESGWVQIVHPDDADGAMRGWKCSASGWAAASPCSRFADHRGYKPGSVEHGIGAEVPRRSLVPA
jgi:hypothetical protein